MRTIFVLLAGGIVAVSILPVGAAELNYTSLIGKWKVQGVKVSGSGVQALVNNDPQYMGAEVEFAADKITWLRGTKAKPLDPSDNCKAIPKLTPADRNDPDSGYRVKGGFNVLCGSAQWGPGAVVRPVQADTVSLYWYDGGILTLKREGVAAAPAAPAAATQAAASGTPSTADCSNASTQADMNECADKAFKASDAALNATYKQIEQRLKGSADAKKLLITAQRAWLAFRDAECAFATSGSSGGSIYPMVYSMCLDTVTQARTKGLQTYLSCGEGDASCPVPASN